MLDWLFGRKKQEPAPQKKQKPSAEQEAEDKWKYDFIIQFLSGPVWKTSILDFVDYHCVVFDTEQQNKFEYTTIHNKFKELVATLFDGMMQEVGLDDQKLAELLEKGFDSKHKKIFNQLLLADDFLKFKQLMVNRNKTLQAQAIKALHQSQGHHHVQKKKQKRIITEQQILRQSKLAEEQRLRKIQQQEEEQLRKALELSKIESQEQNLIKKLEQKVANSELKKVPQVQPVQEAPKVVQPEPVVQKPKIQQPKIAQPVPPVPVQQPHPVQQKPKKNLPSLQPLPPLKNQRRIGQSPVIQQKKEVVKQEVPVVQQKQQAPKVEVQSQQDRKKRLLQQRQRIRRKKQEQRKKEMAEDQKKPVQTIVLQDDGIHETNIAVAQDKKVSMTQIERRRELMKKIKNRIVDDF